MNLTTKALLVMAAFAVAACNNPNRGGMDDGGFGAGGMNGGIVSGGLGDVNDPTSIAYFQQRVGDRVLFEVDQSTLNDGARQVLSGQARWLNDNPQFAVIVEGHADERGTREYNVALGARRAAAVQQYLMAQGISASRLRTVSYGKERPVEACAQQRCWDMNRRAVTVISSGLSG
ncbi:peptidoglycan-associated lipoprotein Pal [Roseicitreum antarcticum]|uniref:Peptidoglycan-associated lipoprotein n=1 Tax=Roseicitreum antarcticum TaxID=564137 RepID=A0A1H2XID1_9RHOB|nr:peptidoglycan-associated lipoprotein Pal [Roseicitreum antarcticum]SDW92580.1 peptidoglycan-associated lipoprotein [Roseicitreum antarcticum]